MWCKISYDVAVHTGENTGSSYGIPRPTIPAQVIYHVNSRAAVGFLIMVRIICLEDSGFGRGFVLVVANASNDLFPARVRFSSRPRVDQIFIDML